MRNPQIIKLTGTKHVLDEDPKISLTIKKKRKDDSVVIHKSITRNM